MIHAILNLVPDSTTPDRPSLYACSCSLAGTRWEVTSRHGATYELCRLLVRLGYPDEPMAVQWNYHAALIVPSIHKAARFTIAEGNRSIREVRWKPIPKFS